LGYHLLNVALHATSAVLLLTLLRRLAIPGAWLAAMVFALHPVCVESAAWISEQKNTLSTVFYLASAISYLRFSDARSPGRYALASLFFVLAVLSKTVTATLPAALLVLMWWRTGSVSWRRDVEPLLPWLAFGAIAGLFSGWVERHYVGAEGAAFDLTGLERLLLASRAAWFYAAKVVWPADLIFFYPRWTISSDSVAAYSYLLGVLAALAALAVVSRRSRAPLAGALFFGGTLFPTLGFFNIYAFVFSYVADHWQYLASLGLIVPLCAVLARAGQRLATSVRRAAASALLAILAVLTWHQAGMYSDMETFYRTTIAKNPGAWMAYNNLGVFLVEQNHLPEAREEFEAALTLRPDYKPAHLNLGKILLDSGQYEEALAQLRMASGTPHKDYVHLYLGQALEGLHQFANAAAEYSLHARLDPGNVEAWFGLGNVLAAQEQYSTAAQAYRRALAIDPHLVDAHNNLGNALLLSGQVAAAVAEYREAVRERPGDPALQQSLQMALDAQAHGGAVKP
jgi:tetratricopeptide (TPR) repeat protein